MDNPSLPAEIIRPSVDMGHYFPFGLSQRMQRTGSVDMIGSTPNHFALDAVSGAIFRCGMTIGIDFQAF